jgi:hypothetical protein
METDPFAHLPDIFRVVCASALSGRYSMDKPFRIGDIVYATDAKIAVRMTATDKDKPVEGAPPADTLQMWNDKYETTPTPIPELGERPIVKCESCNGTGNAQTRCGDCDGTGYVECPHCGNEESCENCKGEGWVVSATPTDDKCIDCKGAGAVPKPVEYIKVGNVYLNGKYLRPLKELGASVFMRLDKRKDSTVRFTVGDCEGILMMTQPPKEADNG